MKRNAIIGQLGGPTSVINASLAGLIQEGLKSKKIKHILGMRDGIIGFLQDRIGNYRFFTGQDCGSGEGRS